MNTNQNDSIRELASSSLRYVALHNGDSVTAGQSSEVFVRMSGRGCILWAGGAEDSRDPRVLGIFLVPAKTSLQISGDMNGLRVELPALSVCPPARPLADPLIGLVCRRAWHGSEKVAEAALVLASLLVLEDIR